MSGTAQHARQALLQALGKANCFRLDAREANRARRLTERQRAAADDD